MRLTVPCSDTPTDLFTSLFLSASWEESATFYLVPLGIKQQFFVVVVVFREDSQCWFRLMISSALGEGQQDSSGNSFLLDAGNPGGKGLWKKFPSMGIEDVSHALLLQIQACGF